MANVNTNNLKRGMVLDLDDGLYQVLEFQHHKPGKGGAMVRTKLRNLEQGGVVDKTFNSGTNVGLAIVDRREMQYLYPDGDRFVLMDNETYEQTFLSAEDMGEDATDYLVEGTTVTVAFHGDRPIGVDLPTAVDLRVTKTEPGVKGDRQSAGTKPATVETGATFNVPLFVDTGDVVRIDTRTGEYVTRVQE